MYEKNTDEPLFENDLNILADVPEFSSEEEEFIYTFTMSKPEDRTPAMANQSDKSIRQLPPKGHNLIFDYFDGESHYAIKLDALEEATNYFKIPIQERNDSVLNPVLKISRKHKFYGARLIDGLEGDDITTHLEVSALAQLSVELMAESSEMHLHLVDVDFAKPHNIFLVNSSSDTPNTQRLTLFDQASYIYDQNMTPEECFRAQFLTELDRSFGPFIITSGTDFLIWDPNTQRISLHPQYRKLLEFLKLFSQIAATKFRWKTMPFHFTKEFDINNTDFSMEDLIGEVEVPIIQEISDFAPLIISTLRNDKSSRKIILHENPTVEITRQEAFEILQKETL